MLEFYQAYSNYHDLMDLTEELVKYVAMEVNGTTLTNFNGVEIDLGVWKKYSMREAIIKFWPPACDRPAMSDLSTPQTFQPFVEKLQAFYYWRHESEYAVCEQILDTVRARHQKPQASRQVAYAMAEEEEKVRWQSQSLVALKFDTKSDILKDVLSRLDFKAFSTVFEVVAEEHLVQPTIIYDFPLAVSPLSKVKPDEPDWVERFEFYIGGFEVGNAFSELNDPDDQRGRFEAQIEERKRGDDEAMAEVDHDYVRALGYGLPPTAGEGIGIDRLTMILTGSKSIRDVILFPLLRPQAKAPE
jgi:lysyl-tRNA synthetase class 2